MINAAALGALPTWPQATRRNVSSFSAASLMKYLGRVTDQHLLRFVPAILRPLAERLGINAVLAVAKSVGGQRIAIPQRHRERSVLARKIGVDAARVLTELYPAANLQVPRAARLIMALRHIAIRTDKRSNNVVAAEWGLTARHVAAIRNAGAQHPPSEKPAADQKEVAARRFSILSPTSFKR